MNDGKRGHFALAVAGLILLVIVMIVPACAQPPPIESGALIPALAIPAEYPASVAIPAPGFIGSPAEPISIRALQIPQNPFMAANGRSCTHDDAYMSDTYEWGGPLGQDTQVLSSYLGAFCGSLASDKAGRLITVSVATTGAAGLWLLDPATLAPLAYLNLPAKPVKLGDLPAGAYFYLDEKDRVVFPTADRMIWIVSVDDGQNRPRFIRQEVYDLTPLVHEDDVINSALPDFSGRLWFTTRNGVVGTINLNNKEVASLQFEGERIWNSIALDETGGVYAVSDHALYRLDADTSGHPAITWREEYQYGDLSRPKPGQYSYGSGTTPTPMGQDFIAITDNADQLHVVVYLRASHVDGPRKVCEIPVFEPGKGAAECSLIGTEKSLVVGNNYGYLGPPAVIQGKTTEPGLTRIDIDPNGTCRIVWTSKEIIPNVASKLSLQNGLVYTYTKDARSDLFDPWYFTAIDFETGKTVYKVLVGTGYNYDSVWSGLHLGPDGTGYVGVLGGVVAIMDKD
ncbi:MAG: hypothetical protein WC169_08640 [Dehalococcoidia bacterium]